MHNYADFVFRTSDINPIKAGPDDRRFMVPKSEITPQMIRILTHDFLIKGITAREAVRRILDEVEKTNGR